MHLYFNWLLASLETMCGPCNCVNRNSNGVQLQLCACLKKMFLSKLLYSYIASWRISININLKTWPCYVVSLLSDLYPGLTHALLPTFIYLSSFAHHPTPIPLLHACTDTCMDHVHTCMFMYISVRVYYNYFLSTPLTFRQCSAT